jgi:methylmalonyl-CoA/ethylmalonyl-CoA epimerase
MIDKLSTDVFQVLVVAKDVDKTAEELAAVFGVDVPASVLLDPEEIAHARYRGKPTSTRAKVVPFLNPGALDIEVIQPDGEPSVWREFLTQNGAGVSHIGIWVENMAEAVAFLTRKGFQVAHQAGFKGGSYAIMDTKEKLGVNIMLKHLD